MPSLKRSKSTLAQMALSSNQYALKAQRLDKILAHKDLAPHNEQIQVLLSNFDMNDTTLGLPFTDSKKS